MRTRFSVGVTLALTLTLSSLTPPAASAQMVTDELDAFWAEVVRTIEEGDFEGYSALYHPDAVLVSNLTEKTYPISGALKGWRHFFDDTKAGTLKASLRLKITHRVNDGSGTALEGGMFHYRTETADGEVTDEYTYFEALLVKKDGQWKQMMEYQRGAGTDNNWDALP